MCGRELVDMSTVLVGSCLVFFVVVMSMLWGLRNWVVFLMMCMFCEFSSWVIESFRRLTMESTRFCIRFMLSSGVFCSRFMFFS